MKQPEYLMDERIIKTYPLESKAWQELMRKITQPEFRGCLTCKFSVSIRNGHFVDVEEIAPGVYLPWDSEEGWVLCKRNSAIETAIRLDCPLWKITQNIY